METDGQRKKEEEPWERERVMRELRREIECVWGEFLFSPVVNKTSYSRHISTARRNVKFYFVHKLKSLPLNDRDSYLQDGVKYNCSVRVFPKDNDDKRSLFPGFRIYDPSPMKHFSGRFFSSTYIIWNCRELSSVYTSLDKCIDRKETGRSAQNDEKRD